VPRTRTTGSTSGERARAAARAPLPPGLELGGSTGGTSLSREDLLEHEEHLANVSRLRMVLAMGGTLWFFTGALDWIVVRWSTPAADLRWMWEVRYSYLVVIALAVLRLRRRPEPGPRELAVIALVVLVGAAAICAVLSLEWAGITSPYAQGVSCVAVGGGMAMPQHWKRGLVLIFAIGLSWPVFFLIAAPLSPAIAAQLHDPAAVVVFTIHNVLILVCCTLLVAGGHAHWKLRRQVYEARSIGRYRLKRRIARGGMGEVWRAYHPALRHDVAVKILRAADHQEGAARRFEREVTATSELTHPNTVRVLDFGVTDDGLWFYAMELLEGETLARLVERQKGLPAARAVHMLRQAARAVAEAHARGIVHRDLKPENLFITSLGGEGDFVKVIDFGIAKGLADAPDHSLTADGKVLGTPLYMAPEQGEGRAVDARSDVYSLGAALYFALTGVPPFAATSSVAILAAHLHHALVPPSARTSRQIPADVEAIVAKCLAKAPADRYADAGELAEALASCSVAGQWQPPHADAPDVVRADEISAPGDDTSQESGTVEAPAPTLRQRPPPH
jgi:tRNA A-37 threonylcarbamoyl transferase component Bud32